MMTKSEKRHLDPIISIFYGLCVILNLCFVHGSSETYNNEGLITFQTSLADDEARIPQGLIKDKKLPLLSSWSEWSLCEIKTCSQKRSRNCQLHWETALCKGSVIEEKRFCSKPHQCKINSKNSLTIKRSQIFRNVPFQMVKRPIKKTLRSMREEDPAKFKGRALRFRSQRMRRKLYSRWSHWTMCSKSCTTQRFRWCKRTAVCGNDVLSESALCYIEGSYCERWIQKRLGESAQEELVANAAKISVNSDSNNNYYASRPKDPPSRRPMRAPKDESHAECGLTANSSSSSSSSSSSLERWNMLRIIGGRPSRKGKWPWQVALLNRFKEAFCGGTLISSMWVVTAAHCIRKKLYIRLGEFDLTNKEGSELEFKVVKAIKHPNYDSETVDNDIALLKLPPVAGGAATGGRMAADWLPVPVCLPRGYQPLPPATSLCTIIGWGKRKSTDHYGTDILHEAQVPIVSNNECREVYDEYRITENMFCAGYRGGRMDSCSGDSGGPLLCRESKTNQWTIHGITSFGEGCGRKGKFGIYTRMSNYVKWARSVMRDYS